jgi:hypothetical protein
MVEQAPPAAKHRSRTRLVVQGVLSLVLVVIIFYFLIKKIDLPRAWAAVTAMTWLELTTLGLLAVWNLCTYAFVWMSVTPGLGFWRSMVMTQATTAVANAVPGGSAIGIGMTYGMLGSWGYSRSRTTTAVLVSGVWNSFIKLGMPVLALALVLLQGGAGGGRVTAALLGIAGLVGAIVVFTLMLRSEEQARRFGLLAGRVASRVLRVLITPHPVGSCGPEQEGGDDPTRSPTRSSRTPSQALPTRPADERDFDVSASGTSSREGQAPSSATSWLVGRPLEAARQAVTSSVCGNEGTAKRSQASRAGHPGRRTLFSQFSAVRRRP